MHNPIWGLLTAVLGRSVAVAVIALGLGGEFAAAGVAADSAADSAYAAEAGGAWKGQYDVADSQQNPPGTDNGGTGFSVWDFSGGYYDSKKAPYGTTNHFIDGVDFPHSTFNNLGPGPAFGMTNFNGLFATTVATRPFAAPLSVGDVFSVKFDTPATYNTSGDANNVYPFVIIGFNDSSGQNTFDLNAGKNAIYGDFPWRYDDATGSDVDMGGIAPEATSDGSGLSFELTSATTGVLTFDVGGPDQRVIPISLLGGAPAAISFTLYSCNTSNNNTGEYELFFNNLSITHPPDNEWQNAAGNNDGNWGDATRWKSGVVPDGTDATANFLSHPSLNGNVTVTIDADRRVGTINFDNPFYSYTLAGSNGITLDVSSGEAQVNVISGSHFIDVPLTLADDTTVTVTSASSTLTLGNVGQESPAKLTKAGAGTLKLAGIGTYTGGTFVAAGVLVAANADALAGGPVNVADGALARAQTGLPKAVTVTTLNTNGSGQFDITNNAMVIRGMTVAQVQALITSGFNNGAWNGAGINSSIAAADANGLTAIGYAANSDYGASDFHGVDGLTANDVLVRYTYYGDADLDGQVTLDDFSQFLNGYQTQSTATNNWLNGDFDYDGAVTLDDFSQFLFGYQNQGAPLGALESMIESSSLSASEKAAMMAAMEAVPEPAVATALSLLIAAGATMTSRRRTARR